MRGLIPGVWWPSHHARLLGDEGSELDLIPEELLPSSWESNPFRALNPCSGLIPNSKHTSLSPSGQHLFGAQPPTGVSIPPSLYSPLFPPCFVFSMPGHPPCHVALLVVGGQGLPPATAPPSQLIPQPAHHSPSVQLSGSVVSSPSLTSVALTGKIAGMGWEGFSVSRYEGKALPGRGLHSACCGLASCLGWVPGSIPDESRQFLRPLGAVAACCSRRTKTY